jgi:hypothetical protein
LSIFVSIVDNKTCRHYNTPPPHGRSTVWGGRNFYLINTDSVEMKTMKELTQIELGMVAGGDRNLGSLYQYTGDACDMTSAERFDEGLNKFLNKLMDAFEQAWH